MPYAGFRCPRCGKDGDRMWALTHFPNEHGGVVPGGVIEALYRAEESPRRSDDHISPSMAGGCMREYALSRLLPTYIDPLRGWKAQEGTLWHQVMAQYPPPGWLAECAIPAAPVIETPRY